VARVLICLIAVLVAAAAATPAAAAAAPAPVRITGGASQTIQQCGARVPATVVRTGAHVTAVVRAARTPAGRRGRRGSRVIVDQCMAGGWAGPVAVKLGARLRALRTPLATTERATGDYRVRIVRRGGESSRPAYVRVGVGEIVDTPVMFNVRNQNRSAIACLGAPDGATYTVRGTLVGPRARMLDDGAVRDDTAATLYYHGLSYASFFFRFQAVPGYDYGMEQARRGHVSIVVDRLGYPGSPGPARGTDVCYSSQADIGDQIIRRLRVGGYFTGEGPGPRFDRIAMAGHSAGGFITEMTQYLWGSADAIAVAGYNDTVPAPLVAQTLVAANARCLTAPDRAQGASGPPGYARFGETDAAFIAGHVHDMDPAVLAVLLRERTRDPCGDLVSIPLSFVADQPLIRTIDEPVLLVAGKQDAFFPPPGAAAQQVLGYVPTGPNVELEELEDTGHAMTLGRTHEAFVAVMDRWLSRHGF
jgi:hypothetical protein